MAKKYKCDCTNCTFTDKEVCKIECTCYVQEIHPCNNTHCPYNTEYDGTQEWNPDLEAEPTEYEYGYEDRYYTPSSTNGDYSPSNPWDAPGMSIQDFI